MHLAEIYSVTTIRLNKKRSPMQWLHFSEEKTFLLFFQLNALTCSVRDEEVVPRHKSDLYFAICCANGWSDMRGFKGDHCHADWYSQRFRNTTGILPVGVRQSLKLSNYSLPAPTHWYWLLASGGPDLLTWVLFSQFYNNKLNHKIEPIFLHRPDATVLLSV